MRGTLLIMSGMVVAALGGTGAYPQQVAEAQDRTRSEMLQAIEQRFWRRVVEDMGLTDDQAGRLQAAVREFAATRRELEREERELKAALARQLRPGIAADQDSVARLTDALLRLRVDYAQTFRDEHQAVGAFLNPVQQAQLLAVRERLLQRIRQIQQQRQDRSRLRRDRMNP